MDGKGVVAGVNYHTDVPFDGNTNHSTDHFITIAGMGLIIQGDAYCNYVSYYDNATQHKSGMDLKENRFYMNRIKARGKMVNILYDATNVKVRGVSEYIMTEVRRNTRFKK